MKLFFSFIFLISSIIVFSQDNALKYKSGGRVFNSNDQRLTSTQMRELLTTNSEALKLYNAGRAKKTVGNILFWGGLGTLAIKEISMRKKTNQPPNEQTSTNNIMYFVGAGIVLVSIPVKLGFSKKIKKAVSLINEDFKNPSATFNIEESSLIANSNGIGISITF